MSPPEPIGPFALGLSVGEKTPALADARQLGVAYCRSAHGALRAALAAETDEAREAEAWRWLESFDAFAQTSPLVRSFEPRCARSGT